MAYKTRKKELSKIDLENFRCPICFQILIEPVTMPCKHELCMFCFKKHVEEVTYYCPICRLRISNWARVRARENSLINFNKWIKIQKAFPDILKFYHHYKSESSETPSKCFNPVLAQSDKLYSEYLEFMAKESERETVEGHNVEDISMPHRSDIRKRAEFEQFFSSLSSQSSPKHTKDDMLLSRSTPSNRKLCSLWVKSAESASGMSLADLEAVVPYETLYRSTSSSSIDSITPEMQVFRPIHASPRTPPKSLSSTEASSFFVSYPPLIRAVPKSHSLFDDTSSESSFASSCSSFSDPRFHSNKKPSRHTRYQTRSVTSGDFKEPHLLKNSKAKRKQDEKENHHIEIPELKRLRLGSNDSLTDGAFMDFSICFNKKSEDGEFHSNREDSFCHSTSLRKSEKSIRTETSTERCYSLRKRKNPVSPDVS